LRRDYDRKPPMLWRRQLAGFEAPTALGVGQPFAVADGRCLFEGLVFIGCGDKAKLFVKLRGVMAFAANDPENDFS